MSGRNRPLAKGPATLRIMVTFAAVSTLTGLVGVRFVQGRGGVLRGSCADYVVRSANRFPLTSERTKPPTNRAAVILDRLWASRSDLKVFSGSSGRPDVSALLLWSQGVPDSSATFVAACLDDAQALSTETGVALSNEGLPLLKGLLDWMEKRTPKSAPFLVVERNRNAMFSLFQLGKPTFVPSFMTERGRPPTASEIMDWAYTVPPDHPDFDQIWSAWTSLDLQSSDKL
jgi:hypothetical protein